MKKFNFVLLSVLTLCLGSVLASCTFKKPEVSFTQDEIVLSVTQQVNLSEYLDVNGIDKSDVAFRFSNSSLFDLQENVLTAKAAGRSYVYATYQNNNLASMQVVVKKPFDAPTQFSLNENGVFSWNAVSGIFENESQPTVASNYVVVGTLTEYSATDPEEVVGTTQINEVVSDTTFQLDADKPGEYKLSVGALGRNYFDNGALSAEQTLYFGYMDKLEAEDLSFNQGVFSWTAVAGAKYKVKLNDVLLDDFQTETSKDLTEYFDAAESGAYSLSVLVYDEAGEKLVQESDVLTIEKLAEPVVEYNFSQNEGGVLQISTADNVDKYQFTLTSASDAQTYTAENTGETISVDFSGIDFGVYDVSVVALSDNQLTYSSDAVEVGKIYKMPTPVLTGTGLNLENGSDFNAQITLSENKIVSNAKILSLNALIEDFQVDELEKDFVLTLAEANIYNLSAKMQPQSAENLIDGENVFVINSDASSTLDVTKLPAFNGEVSHEYQEEKSVLTVAQVENATSYQLFYFDGDWQAVSDSLFAFTTENGVAKFSFNDKIENLNLANGQEIRLKVVAKTADDNLAINSSIEKMLSILQAPTTANSGDSVDKTFVWNASENASGYRLEIYTIDNATYTQNQAEINIDISEMMPEVVSTDSASYTFDGVGYYYVKIYAVSNDENAYISSTACLEEVFYIAEQLTLGTVEFGYLDEYQNQPGFTQATGYFVKIENTENVDNYQISLDSDQTTYQKLEGSETIFLLSEDFASGTVNITVTGHANDETLYKSTSETVLQVERLASITYDDLVFDANTESVTVRAREGVEVTEIWYNEGNSTTALAGEDATFPIGDLNAFELRFSLESADPSSEGIFTAVGGKVYLDSTPSTLSFERLATPVNMEYYDGDITFESPFPTTQLTPYGYYVLRMVCTIPNSQQLEIYVRFMSTGVEFSYGDLSFTYGTADDFRTVGADNKVTIMLSEIIDQIKTNPLLSAIESIYNQATVLEFEAFAYQNRLEGSNILLSSQNATLKSDSTKTLLKVEKMQPTSLTFVANSTNQATDYTLSWNAVETNDQVSSETRYEVFLQGNETALTETASTTYEFSKADYAVSTYYVFYVRATNPYYLESANSNTVRIYKLRSLTSVSLADDGSLNFVPASSEQDYIDHVDVTYNQSTTQNQDFKLQIGTNLGLYTFVVVGKTLDNLQDDNSITYYISSDEASWNVVDLSTLAPTNTQVSYNAGILSWNVFAENTGLSTLKYLVIFKDAEGGVFPFITTQTSLNVLESEVYNSLSDMVAGDITVEVSAYLDTYSVAVGQNVYYSNTQTLLSGNSQFNHYIYPSQQTVVKLKTPEVSQVTFVDTDLTTISFPTFSEEELDFDKLQNPDIAISFVGNYADVVNVSVFLNDNTQPVFTGQVTKSNESYTVTLTSEAYRNAFVSGVMTVKIRVNDSTAIPSSVGSVDINRAADLQSIAFEQDGGNLTQNLIVTFDGENSASTIGGVAFKIEYVQAETTETKTLYTFAEVVSVDEENAQLTFDLSSVFEDYLSMGGQISVEAFINSYDDGNPYYIASASSTTTAQLNVLKGVTSTDITRQSGGFVIADLNNSSTVYVVEYGSNRFEVESSDQGFYFEFPNDWIDAEYNLTIYATENGYISSVKNVVSFTLNRIEQVSGATFSRSEDDLSEVTLSWNGVAAATGYLFKVYQDETLIFSTELAGTQTSYTTTDIFGENYAELLAQNNISLIDLQNDLSVRFAIVAVGSSESVNNSLEYSFDGVIKGNSLLTAELSDIFQINEYGQVVLSATENTTYLYSFLSTDTRQAWKNVLANSSSVILDTSELAKELSSQILFNVELSVQGNAENFELDSYFISTEGNTLSFLFNDALASVGYNSGLSSALAIETVENSFSKIFVGLSEDALNLAQVAEVVPTLTDVPASNDIYKVYSLSLADLLDALEEAGIKPTATTDLELYFWAYSETDDATNEKTVVSAPYMFTFDLTEESDFVGIQKLGPVADNENYTEDYVNSFAVFNNSDTENLQTLGFYVKITSQGTEPFSTIKFVSNAQLVLPQFDTTKYVVNLTSLFEEEDLLNLAGTFTIQFARLQLQTSASGEKFVVTDWLSSFDEQTFEFVRLNQVQDLTLSNGNLYWRASDENATKYYVYFIQDMDIETGDLGENYAYLPTSSTNYSVSDYASTGTRYYLAVQSINEDPFVLSSSRVFILDAETTLPAPIYRNQITSPLSLQSGKLVIDWTTDSEIFTILSSGTDYPQMLTALLDDTPFTNPFTFTLDDLVNDQVTIRLRFTPNDSAGRTKTFDFNAKYLLADLYEFGQDNNLENIETVLREVYTNATESFQREILSRFIDLIENGSHGVANYVTLFDDIFESLQTGAYKVEYCLVGGNYTLNSPWYSFSNANQENVVYVNPEPVVRAIPEKNATDISLNTYKILIKKSQIYDYDAEQGQYVQKTAENYVMKLLEDAGNYLVFNIQKGISDYSLTLKDSEKEVNVTVYETDADGTEVVGGDYLMFYLNHNDGNSVLGVYEDEIGKRTYQMQIYAVGNDYSMSSKSEYFSMIMLGFGDSFSINQGVFSWIPQLRRATTIVYRKNGSSAEEKLDISVDAQGVASRFSLETLGDGLYDYIKFFMKGEVRQNSIFVDSEIYQINNVYKLSTPSLNNNFGFIGIDDSANVAKLANSYSDTSLYNYRVYNNALAYDENDSSTYIYLTNDTPGSVLYYEAGVTGMDETTGQEDYTYKSSEENATEFNVASLGSTSSFIYESGNTVNEQNYNTTYYLKTVYPVDTNGEKVEDKSVSARSNFASISAKMLPRVTDLQISDGVLTWTGLENSGGILTESLEKLIYKVRVVQYRASGISQDETIPSNIDKEYVYYTANNSFDFALIEEDMDNPAVDETVYLMATVQALGLNVVQTAPAESYVSLIEGGYAYGNVRYAGEEVSYVLLSNGETIDEISRLDPVENLEVSNGSLYWNFRADDPETTEVNFFEKYSFVVTQVTENGERDVSGEFVATLVSETYFRIQFIENKGAFESGVSTIKVYTTQGTSLEGKYIKSFARVLSDVTKLGTLTTEDFVIQSDIDFETLDLSGYLADENTNVVTMTVTVGQEAPYSLQFSRASNRYKMYILRSEEDAALLPSTYPEGYIRQYLVVSDDEVVTIKFRVTSSNANTIYSDESDDFLLQRSSWEDNTISWDEENQQFVWTYPYKSLQANTTADKLVLSNVLTESVTLYLDETLAEGDQTLEVGTQIEVVEELETCTKISVDGEEYFIENGTYEEHYVVETSGVELHMGDVFTVLETETDTSIISYPNAEIYRIASNLIEDPIFIVEATYYGADENIVRTYTTAENSFKPTIIGQVGIKVRIKISDANLQSQELEFVSEGGQNFEMFNLFESGQGTSADPYIISNGTQFRNLAYRMQKPTALNNYVETTQLGNREISEETQFYFRLSEDIALSQKGEASTYVDGLLFAGEFQGDIDGNGKTISYIGTYTKSGINLAGITVSVGNILGPQNGDTQTTYYYGISLFENLGATANVHDLGIDVIYADTQMPTHTLVAGLVLTNSGQIDNVTLKNFQNGSLADDPGFQVGLRGYGGTNVRVMMVYSGIASINMGASQTRITNCRVETDMILDDTNNSQIIFASGIVYTNYALVENCVVGTNQDGTTFDLSVNCSNAMSAVQAAGIAITNASSGATISSCQNNFDISISCTSAANYVTAYLAGIVDLGLGTLRDNVNNGNLTHSNITTITQGDIYATNRQNQNT